MTNIEKIQSERLAAEFDRLSRLPASDAMLTAAVHDILEDVTGCSLPVPMDGATPVIPTSDIQEAVSLMTAIDRRILTNYLTMLGMSPADLLRTLMANRIQGDPTHGIPSLLGSSLPTISSALLSRKISGVPEAADGISLVHLMANPSAVTELKDDNEWSTENYFPATLFPNLAKVTANLKEWYSDSLSTTKGFIKDSSSITEIVLPSLKKIDGTGGYYGAGFNIYFLANLNGLEKVTFSELEYCRLGILVSGNNVTEIVAEKLVDIKTNVGNGYAVNFVNCPKLRKLVLGKVESISINGLALNNCTDLIHFEFGAGVDINLTLAGTGNSINWNPTNALDASRTDLIEEGSTAANNLEQFLSNFKTYIALRLAAFDSNGPTLTLSAAVFSSIWDPNGDPQNPQPLSPDICQEIDRIIIRTKHWNVNKA